MNRLFILSAAVLLISTLAFGQAETTGRISGRVVDESGGPIADARVALVSSALQGERQTRTDGNGKFLAALLPVGPYAVSIASPGKQTAQISLRLGVGQTVPIDVTMKPGEEIVEKITVYGTATPLETTVVGESFDYEKKVEEMPIALRNIPNVSTYAPNVVQGPWAPDVLLGTAAGLVVSGAPAYDTNVQLEGADISDPIFGLGVLLYLEDAVEEVQVQTSGLSARYGRFQGGVINTITKTGGNEFDGTVRVELSNEDWNSTTPFGEAQSDNVNEVYQATVGGYMLKDKLWFFAGGRWVPTKTSSGTAIGTGEGFSGETDDERWQIKLRGAPSADHVIEASYLDRDFETTAGGFNFGDLLAATAYYNLEPMSLFSLGYQGILGPASFLDVRASSKRHGTTCCSTGEPRSPFFDVSQSALYNNSDGDPGQEWRRDGLSVSAAFTRIFHGGDYGSHTLETGVQFVRSTVSGGSSVGPTGYSMDAIPVGTTPFAAYDPNTGELRYNIGGEVLNFRWQNIPVGGLESEIDNHALYAQDGWQVGQWRFDVGLRWERYEVSTYRDDLEKSVTGLAPRFGVTRNISPKLQVQATWGRYFGKFPDRLLGPTARILDYSLVERFYTDPARTGLTADEIEVILRDDTQWDLVTAILDPNQPTAFLADGIDLPYTDELTLGVRAGLPRNFGSLTATYIDRDYKDLFDDFVGDFGSRSIVDPFDPVSGQTTLIDNVVWDNASGADRRYRAVAITGDYRPGARWDIGGNWTFSELTGNQDIPWRQVINGTAIGTYERSRPERAAVPDGDLLDDVRHRIQAWGNYRWDLDRMGSLTLGVVGRYESGRSWSRTAWVGFPTIPSTTTRSVNPTCTTSTGAAATASTTGGRSIWLRAGSSGSAKGSMAGSRPPCSTSSTMTI